MENKETLEEVAEKSAIEQMEAGNSAYILGFTKGAKWQQENSNINALEFEIAALKSIIQDMDATVKSKYSEEDMVKFVSFVGKNYIKAKGFYYVKGDFEKSIKVSIHHILKQYKKK